MKKEGSSEFFSKVITVDNVKEIGEGIAISAMKKLMPYSGTSLDDLYRGLVHDTYDGKTIDEQYSDGYDIAEEAICFLCGYIGKSLNEECITDKKGRLITIIWGCYKTVFRYIEKRRGAIYNIIRLDNLNAHNEPYTTYEEHIEKDYTAYDTILDKMNLTPVQLETLNCYLAGMAFLEIARYLNVDNSTVWRRRKQIQNIYNQKVLNMNY